MIYNLRSKFIKICTVSFLIVFFLIFIAIYAINIYQRNQMVDVITDIISENNGRFPVFDGPGFEGGGGFEKREKPMPGVINDETRFATRYFNVRLSESNKIISVDTEFVSSITEDEAKEYAELALNKSKDRGWLDEYRYKIYDNSDGCQSIVFVNGSMFHSTSNSYMLSTLTVLIISSFAVLTMIIIISKKAVRPAAESYEKQKQFITDANHELKTPLTLILTNVDIAESEMGQNEWLDDIRSEGRRMSALVNKLVTLTRMDENSSDTAFEDFCLSDAVEDTISEFTTLAESKDKHLVSDIAENILHHGNESEIRQLIAILLDNAVKYCDNDGEIRITLKSKKHPVLLVENTFNSVNSLKLNKLFDRFYRADKARTAGNGFGIGLSIAKSIIEKHGGSITVQSIEGNIIRFKVKL